MESPDKENSVMSTVMEELIKVEEKMNKLESFVADGMGKELLMEVRSSILKALTAINGSGEVSEVCQDSDRRSESGSRKRKAVPVKGGKGGSRRRMSSYPSRKKVAKTAEDGFSWRKYGQKEIFGSKSPRSYFRCTHKHDRNCQATRQVQKSEEDSSLYVITYMGEHTCRDPINASQILPSAPLQGSSSLLISFASNNNGENIELPFGPFSSLKQEADEEVLSNMTSGSPPPDVATLATIVPEMTPDDTSGFDASSDCLDMGMMHELFDIDAYLMQEQCFEIKIVA